MGYAYYGLDDGFGSRGYSVPDKCQHPGCTEDIDRGLGCLCYDCTKYFCDKHLTYGDGSNECFAGKSRQVCFACDTCTVTDGAE